jgi:hypothetical protein
MLFKKKATMKKTNKYLQLLYRLPFFSYSFYKVVTTKVTVDAVNHIMDDEYWTWKGSISIRN